MAVSKYFPFNVPLLLCILLLQLFYTKEGMTLFVTGTSPQMRPITPPGTYTSYIIGPLCRPTGPIRSPTTTAQVVSIVKTGIQSGQNVKAFGNLHSMTDIICTGGIAIHMGLFKEIRRMNSDLTVTVSAGYTLRELQAFLHSKGRALRGGPVYGGISVGGALGTGAHGSSLKFDTTISSQAISVRIVDGSGNIRQIVNANQMRAFRVHVGMLGVILEVTLSTVPDFKITATNQKLSDDVLTNGVWESIVRLNDYAEIRWFPASASKSIVSTTANIVPVSTPGKAWTNVLPTTTPEYNLNLRLGYTALQLADTYDGMSVVETLAQKFYLEKTIGVAPFFTEDGTTMKNPATGYRYLMQDSICGDSCLWNHAPNNITYLDNSVALDLKNFTAIINTVKSILTVYPATFQLQGIWLRFTVSSDSYLSTSNGRETFYMEFDVVRRDNIYETASSGLPAFQAIMQALVFTYGGRTHWGKNGLFYINRPMIQQKLSGANRAAFIAEMANVDSSGLYMNDFGRRLLNTRDEINSDTRTTHCALQDNCICKINAINGDCAPLQTCTTLAGFPDYPVCKNKGLGGLINEKLSSAAGFLNVLGYFKSVNLFHSKSQLISQ